MNLLDEIKQKSRAQFRPASGAAITALRSLGAPEDVLAFYRNSEPTRFVEIGKVRLWPISDILVENRDAVPGCYIQPCGYVVVGTTLYGDAFCSEIRTESGRVAPVVLITHELAIPDDEKMNREDLVKLAKPIAASFDDFLKAFVSETLDIEPLSRARALRTGSARVSGWCPSRRPFLCFRGLRWWGRRLKPDRTWFFATR